MVKDAGVRYGGPWFELWQAFFSTLFAHIFYPARGDCSIRVSRSIDFTLAWFLLYNFVAVILLLSLFKL